MMQHSKRVSQRDGYTNHLRHDRPIRERWPLPLLILGAIIVAIAGNQARGAPVRDHTGAQPTHAQHAWMLTFGGDAKAEQGDPDHRQLVLITLPKTASANATPGTSSAGSLNTTGRASKQEVQLELHDPDCGGDADKRRGKAWDTQTRFTLYGGTNADTTHPALRQRVLSPRYLHTGTVLAQETYGQSAAQNNKWVPFASFTPQQGERLDDGRRAFKLVVEGLSGDDGNAYHVRLANAPDGATLTVIGPTVSLPEPGTIAELRFAMPTTTKTIALSQYDFAGANIQLVTPLQDHTVEYSAPTAQWRQTQHTLDEAPDTPLAIVLESNGEYPNTVSLHLSAEGYPGLPVQLPMRLFPRNTRPTPRLRVTSLGECRSIAVDGTASTDADGDSLTYLWDFNDGHTATGARALHHYDKPGSYQGHLIVHDTSGQIASGALVPMPVTINHPPTAVITAPAVAAPGEVMTLHANASTDTDGTIGRISWDLGDGGSANKAIVRHRYLIPGRPTVTLRVFDNSGSSCDSAKTTHHIWVNAPPIAQIQAPHRAAIGETLLLSGSDSSDSDGEVTQFRWNFGDNQHKGGARVEHSYSRAGTYSVTLQVTDNAQASNSTASQTHRVIVNAPPEPKLQTSLLRAAVGQVIAFDASASHDPDGTIIRALWDFGEEASAQGFRVNHAFLSPGRYPVTLSVEDDSGTRSSQAHATVEILINAPPIAQAGPDRMVFDSDVAFDGTTSTDPDGKIVSYLWAFGDGSTATTPTAVHAYGNPGIYNVSLTVTDDSGTLSNTTTDNSKITINAIPIADAGPPRSVAPGQAVHFSGSESIDPDGEIVTYHWDFADGHHGDGMNVGHTFEHTGVYNVRLSVGDNSGRSEATDTDVITVTVNTPPTAHAGGPRMAAPGTTLTFDGSASTDPDGHAIIGHRWDFSDGKQSANTAQTSRTFTQPGIYAAILTVTDNSGAPNASGQDRALVHINAPPTVDPGPPIISCSTTVHLDAGRSSDSDGDPLSFVWDFGDGTATKQGVKAYHTYAQGGTYPVILTASDGRKLPNSSSTESLTVTINRPPTAIAGDNKTVCAGDTVLFNGARSSDPEHGRLKFLWDFGDETSARSPNPSKMFTRGGVFQVNLTVEDDSGLECNSATDTVVVQVAESPVANAGPDQTVCANTEVHFDGSKSRDFDGLVNGYAWNFGDGSTGGGATPSHVYTEPGTYRVGLTITGDQVGDCDNTSRDELLVTVHDAPVARFTSVPVVAVGQTVPFNATASSAKNANITKYSWDFGDGTPTGRGVTTTHSYDQPGRYLAVLSVQTDAETSCNVTTARSLVVVNAPPIADAGPERTLGVNELGRFSAARSRDPDGSVVGYTWDFGDGTTATGVDVRHRYSKSGTYTITLTVLDNTGVTNNRHQTTTRVHVNTQPVAAIAPIASACPGDTIPMDGSQSRDDDGNIQKVLWHFGDGAERQSDGITDLTTQHTYGRPGDYQVTLTVDDGSDVSNSRAEASHIVHINHPPIAHAGPDHLACPGDVLNFNAKDSQDPDGEPLTFRWSFTNNSDTQDDTANASSTNFPAQTGAAVQQSFPQPGNYLVTLTATDNSNQAGCNSHQDTATVTVNAPPIAKAGPDQTVQVGGAYDYVVFDGSASIDPDDGQLNHVWDFGDGTTDIGARVVHRYTNPGTYTVRLTVRDRAGTPCSTASDTLTVTAKPRANL